MLYIPLREKVLNLGSCFDSFTKTAKKSCFWSKRAKRATIISIGFFWLRNHDYKQNILNRLPYLSVLFFPTCVLDDLSHSEKVPLRVAILTKRSSLFRPHVNAFECRSFRAWSGVCASLRSLLSIRLREEKFWVWTSRVAQISVTRT